MNIPNTKSEIEFTRENTCVFKIMSLNKFLFRAAQMEKAVRVNVSFYEQTLKFRIS